MIYSIEYSTENNYDSKSEVFLEYLVIPEETPSQQVLSFLVYTEPKANYSINSNVYGFKKLTFNGLHQIDNFKLKIKVEVEKSFQFPHLISPFSLKKEREIINSFAYLKNNHFYLTQTNFTRITSINKNKNIPKRNKSIMEYCSALNQYLHNEIEYCTNSTTIETDAHTAFNLRRGVCQDFSHIFIGLARQEEIAARYVSGYLFIDDKTEAQLHAWAEVLIPSLGWVGFDPTNNLLINENYFKIAHGIDYTECTPLRGVVRGGEKNTTQYKVIIQQQQQ
ncbi:MAG: transglutaminase family protein [Chitinophagales bacterium]